jgi:hypothetical protein
MWLDPVVSHLPQVTRSGDMPMRTWREQARSQMERARPRWIE